MGVGAGARASRRADRAGRRQHRRGRQGDGGGGSGLLATARTGEKAEWHPAHGTIRFPSGATGIAYSGANPAKLRGPQHHFAWCDELAKWRHPEATWTMLQMGMRLGEAPRLIVTTTPAPVPLLTMIEKLERTHVTRGRTRENPHLPGEFVTEMEALYGGTRLGRQELDGVLFEDFEHALWTRELIERSRCDPPAGLVRIVIGVDPPGSAEGDACGIVACGVDADGIAYVLADHSVAGKRPQGWAAAVARAAEAWEADRVIAESNNGGEMVEAVLRGAAPGLPVRLVHASRGKVARAEPVAGEFEAGRIKLAGRFPALEDELAAMTPGGYRGPGSPDRADAAVWALTELSVKVRKAPQIRFL